jgi:hypothetical protein
MKLKIEIDMDGAAFEEFPAQEVARMIEARMSEWTPESFEELALRGEALPLRDTNGNRCGFARVEES